MTRAWRGRGRGAARCGWIGARAVVASSAPAVRRTRGGVGKCLGSVPHRRELVEEVDADDAAGGRSADDNRLPLRLRHHRRGRDARHREPRLHRRCRQRRDERRRGGEKAEEQHEASHVDLLAGAGAVGRTDHAGGQRARRGVGGAERHRARHSELSAARRRRQRAGVSASRPELAAAERYGCVARLIVRRRSWGRVARGALSEGRIPADLS